MSLLLNVKMVILIRWMKLLLVKYPLMILVLLQLQLKCKISQMLKVLPTAG
ncbi:hypothetical protein D3C78_1866810 [compost metagenome]